MSRAVTINLSEVTLRLVIHSRSFLPYKLVVVQEVNGSEKMNRVTFVRVCRIKATNRRPRK